MRKKTEQDIQKLLKKYLIINNLRSKDLAHSLDLSESAISKNLNQCGGLTDDLAKIVGYKKVQVKKQWWEKEPDE